MTVHEHQWVFAGELALTVSESDLRSGDISFRRLEYCLGCASIRVQFGNNWWYWDKAQATVAFLEQFDSCTDTVLKKPPKEFKIRAPRKQDVRLGRGLGELMREAHGRGTLIKLFPKKGEPE